MKLVHEDHGYDFHSYRWNLDLQGVDVEVVFDRIYEDRGAIWCEVTARGYAGEREVRLISPARTNLLNTNRSGWKAHAESLNEVHKDPEWPTAVQYAVETTIHHYRAGEPATDMSRNLDVPTDSSFLLEPFIAAHGVSVFYGEGGLGKSLIALAMGMSVCADVPIFNVFPTQAGPVIYFDYEDDDRVHSQRLRGLMQGFEVDRLRYPFIHKRLVAKIAQAQSDMRKEIAAHDAVLAIVDSIGMGRGGDAVGSEDTIRLFRALRSFDVPVLAIDHLSQDAIRRSRRRWEDLVPYGSIYTVNSSRLLWGAIRASSSTATHQRMNLYNTKANHVMRADPVALEIEFKSRELEHGGKALDRVMVRMYDRLWQEVSIESWTVVKNAFDRHPNEMLSIASLEDLTGLSGGGIRKVLKDHDHDLVKEKNGRAWVYQLTHHAARLRLTDGDDDGEQAKS